MNPVQEAPLQTSLRSDNASKTPDSKPPMKKRYFFFLLEPVLILFVFGVLGYLFNVDIFAKKLSAPVTYMTLWLTGSFLLRKDKIKVNVEKTLNMLAKKSIAIHVVIVVLFYYLQVLDHKWFYLTAFVALTLLEMIGITLFFLQ
jgi:hypothetical protein